MASPCPRRPRGAKEAGGTKAQEVGRARARHSCHHHHHRHHHHHHHRHHHRLPAVVVAVRTRAAVVARQTPTRNPRRKDRSARATPTRNPAAGLRIRRATRWRWRRLAQTLSSHKFRRALWLRVRRRRGPLLLPSVRRGQRLVPALGSGGANHYRQVRSLWRFQALGASLGTHGLLSTQTVNSSRRARGTRIARARAPRWQAHGRDPADLAGT